MLRHNDETHSFTPSKRDFSGVSCHFRFVVQLLKMAETRNKSDCPILGSYMEIHDNVLPTYENVMRHYYFVRNTLRQEGANYEPASAEIALIVADKVLSIWNKASLPTLLHKSVVKRIIAYNNEIQKLKKHAQRMDETYLKKIEQFRMDSQRIFDICSCNCKCFSTCKCSSVKKKYL